MCFVIETYNFSLVRWFAGSLVRLFGVNRARKLECFVSLDWSLMGFNGLHWASMM